jgi:hypothetical protein
VRETDPRRTPDHLPAQFASPVVDAPRGGGLNGRRTSERSRSTDDQWREVPWDLDLLTADDVCTLIKVKRNWLYDTVESEALRRSGWGSSCASAPRP